MIWKNSQLIKKAKIKLKVRDMKSVLSALLRFFETKQVKSGPGKFNTPYYQVTEVFESVLNIQQHAGRKDDSKTRR